MTDWLTLAYMDVTDDEIAALREDFPAWTITRPPRRNGQGEELDPALLKAIRGTYTCTAIGAHALRVHLRKAEAGTLPR